MHNQDQVASGAFRLTQFTAVKIKTPAHNKNSTTSVYWRRCTRPLVCLARVDTSQRRTNKLEQQMVIGSGDLWRFKPEF